MYKIHDNLLPLSFGSLFSKNYCIHNYNTRQRDSFHVISHIIEVRELSIKIRGTNLWNSFHVISHRTKVRELSIKIRGTNLWKQR